MPPDTVDARARKGNRRRLLVFALTFVLALAAGQAWNFLRPAEYQVSTRLELVLPDMGRQGSQPSTAFATKLQLLNSRPVVTGMVEAIDPERRHALAGSEDAVSRVQAMLEVLPVSGAEVVEVKATGREPRLLVELLAAMPDVLRKELSTRQQAEADSQLAHARRELDRLERGAADRRARLESYRQRAGVLAERDDNDAIVRSKGVGQALNVAIEKEAAAAARVQAISKAVEAGQVSTQVRADPVLTGLEARANQVREELREMERSFTADFMAMDPRARTMRVRLAELEQQIARQRVTSQHAALQSAQEDHASAVAMVEKLRNQAQASRPALVKTSLHLREAKLLEDDLMQIEKARREVLERVARFEADEQRRVAVVKLVEPPALPAVPFRPEYMRDAAWVLGAAFALALVAMGLVEVFNRAPAPTPSSPVTALVMPRVGVGRQELPLSMERSPWALEHASDRQTSSAALPRPMRVLDQRESLALLIAASGQARWLCAMALLGLTFEEARALQYSDLDDSGHTLRIRGGWARTVGAPSWLGDEWFAVSRSDELVFADSAGQALSDASTASLVLGAALDAGLPDPAAVTWEVLRVTCIDWLVGQGLRFSDLPRHVGHVDAAVLASVALRHDGIQHGGSDGIELLMPALRAAPTAT